MGFFTGDWIGNRNSVNWEGLNLEFPLRDLSSDERWMTVDVEYICVVGILKHN